MRQIPHTSDKGRVVTFVIDIVLESSARGRPTFRSRFLSEASTY